MERRRGKTSRRLCALLIAAAFLWLSGCHLLLENEQYEESPHSEQHYEDLDAGDLTASTESELKNAIIHLVRNAMTEGTIKFEGYQGDPKRDLSSALADVSNEPISKYAVYYMTHDPTRVLRNQATITIKYKKTPEQIASIVQAGGVSELTDHIRVAMRNFETELVVEMSYYDESQHNPVDLAGDIYYSDPVYAVGYPEISVTVYPDSGLRRIMEITLKHPYPQREMRSKTIFVNDAVEGALKDLPPDLEPGHLILALHDRLTEMIAYDYDSAATANFTGKSRFNEAWTVYGAFVEKRAVGEGYALAMKYLCDRLSIPCRVIRGRFNGEEHAWNIVELGENWYHLDAAADDISGTYDYFLKNDADMTFWREWDQSIQACSADSIPIEVFRPQEADEPEEGEEGSEEPLPEESP